MLGRAAGDCLFCHRRVMRGAFWSTGYSPIVICHWCVVGGELGKLIGDAVEDAEELAAALRGTEMHAWRSRVLAGERRAREGRS
jgi:hypothetical protein